VAITTTRATYNTTSRIFNLLILNLPKYCNRTAAFSHYLIGSYSRGTGHSWDTKPRGDTLGKHPTNTQVYAKLKTRNQEVCSIILQSLCCQNACIYSLQKHKCHNRFAKNHRTTTRYFMMFRPKIPPALYIYRNCSWMEDSIIIQGNNSGYQ